MKFGGSLAFQVVEGKSYEPLMGHQEMKTR